MSNIQTTLSSFAVGIPVNDHTISTACPHCAKEFTVAIVKSQEHARDLMSILQTVLTAQAHAPMFSGETRGQATVKTPRATAQDKPKVTSPVTRPRYRYFVADRRKKPELSPSRAAVYKVITRAQDGVLAREIIEKAKVTHGTVQQTLHWLREHKLVKAVEEVNA